MKKIIENRLTIICLLLLLSLPDYSVADGLKDNELWTGIELEYSPFKDFDICFEQERRFDNDITEWKQHLTNLGVKYELNSNFKFAAFYRYKTKPDDIENSFYLHFYAKEKFKPFELTFRLRYHRKYPHNDDIENYFRPKLTIEYDLAKRITPFVSSEYFYHAFYDKGDRFDKMRYYIGITFEPFKDHKFDLSYMHQQEFNVKKPEMSNVFGLFYSWDIDF